MIKYDGKRAVFRVLNAAVEDALDEQNKMCQGIDVYLEDYPHITFQKGTEQAAADFSAILNAQPLSKTVWLPEGVDQIPDADMRGALGIYNAAINQLECIKASCIFYKTLAQCN